MLLELNLAIRLGLLVLLTVLTVRYSARGLQNGILLLLVTSLLPMHHATLIKENPLPLLTLDRIVWPLVLLVFVLQRRQGKTRKCSADLTEYSMFILLLVILLSVYIHGTYISDIGSSEKLQFFGVLGFVLPFMAYFIMRRAVLSEAQVKSFLTGVGLITLYIGLTGLGEAWHQSWLVFPKYILNPYEGIHFGKVRGPFTQASWNGLAMAMGLPILFWLLFKGRDAYRWLWLVGIVSVGVSLPYVLQRAAWLSAVVAFGAAILTWPKQRYLLKLQYGLIGGILLGVSIVGFGLPETVKTDIFGKLTEEENIDFRYIVAAATMTIIDNHVLTGVGLGMFQPELVKAGLEEYSSHNTILTLLAELGLFGFLSYLFIFASLFFVSAKAYLLLPGRRAIIGVLWGVTGAYIIMSLAVELRGVLYVNVLFFALWGMLLENIRRQYRLVAIRKPYIMRQKRYFLNRERLYERQQNDYVRSS